MGWIFSLALLIVGNRNNCLEMVIAAGLFAIAGAISMKNFK